jgi:hypothetical protein
MIPGEVYPVPGKLVLNAVRPTVTLEVANTGDRTIQVGSLYHFFPTKQDLLIAVLRRYLESRSGPPDKRRALDAWADLLLAVVNRDEP